jgi:sigma-E factor negative regulatory protein RseC
MLTETARIVAVEPGWVWVETVRQSTCGSCAAASGCGHGLLNKLGDGRRSLLKLPTDAFPADEFNVDDQVSIAIPERLLLDGSFVVYGVPLLGMLGGAAIAVAVQPASSDALALLGAGIGLLLGLGAVRLHAWLRRNDDQLHPKLMGLAHLR